MSFDSHVSRPGLGASAGSIGGSSEPNLLSKRTWLQVDHELQKALLVAIELVGMLRRFHRDPRQSTLIQREIAVVVHWVSFLIEQREHAAVEITEARPEVVKLSARVVCERCRTSTKDNLERASSHEVPPPRPIWQTQLEFLLTCIRRVAVELFERDCATSHFERYPDCLGKLMNALLRQQRFLASMGAGQTKIEVQHSSDRCAECGQPISPPPEAAL